MLIKTIITPTILSNTETWHKINKKEENMIRKQHHEILTKCLEIPTSTPYYGIISELGIVPYKDLIWYKKLLWLHKLMNSEEESLRRY